MLRLELLGPPQVVHIEHELVLPRKAVALVAYLALEGRSERGRLVELLWGSLPEAKGQHSLRQTLYQLTKTPLHSQLHICRSWLELHAGFALDVIEFRQQVEAGHWAEARRLYRGEFLQGWELEEEAYRLWLGQRRERLREQLQAAMRAQARDLEAQGALQQALELYLELLRCDELQEQHYRDVMRLYAALGQPERALAQYQQLQRVLERELALEPLPEIQALAEQIRLRPSAPAAKPQSYRSLAHKPPLVGREDTLQRMQAAWQDGKTLLLAGPAGIGKSRLAEAFLSRQGSYTVLSGQPEETQTPYASMSRWLRQALRANPKVRLKPWVRLEAARLLPELSPTLPPPLEESTQVRFFSALLELLTQAYGCSTFLSEDEHYSDPWSLRVLAAGRGTIRLVATFRPEELLPEVAKRYADWCSSRVAQWFDLEPLSELAVAELIAYLSGCPASLFPRRIYQVTSGNPLFVLETLQSLFELGELRLGEGGVWETPYDEATHDYTELQIAPSVRQTILGRLERQGAAVRRCLEVAALIADSSFDSKTLAEATALSDWEVCEALERAAQARLLEATAQGYGFSHDLIARTIAESLKPDRKRLISARLARHYAGQAVHPARVAGYFQTAGQLEQAAGWWHKAALQARAVLAFREADIYYGLALEALPPEHPERFELLNQRFYLGRQTGTTCLEQQLDLLDVLQRNAQTARERSNVWFYRGMVLDDQQDLLGAMEASWRAYAFALQVSVAEAFYPLVFVTHYQRDLGLLEEAMRDGQQLFELALGLSPFYTVEAQICHSLTLMLQQQAQAALDLLAEAETLMQQHGPAPSDFWLLQERIGIVRARVLNSLGRFAEVAPQLEPLLEKARQGGVQRQELVALLVRAEAGLGLGDTAQVTQDLERGLELAQALNWGWSEVRQLYAELELLQNNPKAALRLAEQALQDARGNLVNRINALFSRGGAWLALGEPVKAEEDLQQALALRASINRFRSVTQAKIEARRSMTIH
jgi:DNA-binding SARP family transcriptional activator